MPFLRRMLERLPITEQVSRFATNSLFFGERLNFGRLFYLPGAFRPSLGEIKPRSACLLVCRCKGHHTTIRGVAAAGFGTGE